MGRIKTTLIKRSAERLIRHHADEFEASFQKNKELVSKFAEIPSKKLRNKIAGYVTHLHETRDDLSS